MILGKSNHPVYLKKIGVKVWSLRDEVEATIEAIDFEVNTPEYESAIKDIASFYQLTNKTHKLSAKSTQQESLEQKPKLEIVEENSTEEVDEDMSAMMDALESENNDTEQTPEGPSAQTADEVQIKSIDRSVPESINPGTIMLSDINMEHVLVFSREGYTIGQTVVIEFDIPKSFKMTATIVNCQPIGQQTRIISDNRPRFRSMLRFTHLLPGERTQLRQFLKSIEPDLPKAQPKKAQKEADEAADELDDIDSELAELGL